MSLCGCLEWRSQNGGGSPHPCKAGRAPHYPKAIVDFAFHEFKITLLLPPGNYRRKVNEREYWNVGALPDDASVMYV